MQFGQYFATSIGSGDNLSNRILTLIYNLAGTNYALEVWRYEGSVWNQCAVKGASLQTMPIDGYGTPLWSRRIRREEQWKALEHISGVRKLRMSVKNNRVSGHISARKRCLHLPKAD